MKLFQIGSTRGSIYDYASPGDTLAMHVHGAGDAHTVIVARGAIRLRVQQPDGSIEETEYDSGAFVDTHAGFPHEIVALDYATRTIHHVK